jgi:hypothetical protein
MHVRAPARTSAVGLAIDTCMTFWSSVSAKCRSLPSRIRWVGARTPRFSVRDRPGVAFFQVLQFQMQCFNFAALMICFGAAPLLPAPIPLGPPQPPPPPQPPACAHADLSSMRRQTMTKLIDYRYVCTLQQINPAVAGACTGVSAMAAG